MKALPRRTNFEYRSKEEVNGWPLIHINLGIHPKTGQPLVAKGFVAIGNIAFGIVSIGAAAFGVITLAGFGLGVVSIASLAIGIVALGVIALGNEVALGVLALSSKFSLGVITFEISSVVWSLVFAILITLLIWGLRNVMTGRPQS